MPSSGNFVHPITKKNKNIFLQFQCNFVGGYEFNNFCKHFFTLLWGASARNHLQISSLPPFHKDRLCNTDGTKYRVFSSCFTDSKFSSNHIGNADQLATNGVTVAGTRYVDFVDISQIKPMIADLQFAKQCYWQVPNSMFLKIKI